MTRIISADEARALREAATPGPWEWRSYRYPMCDALVGAILEAPPEAAMVVDLGNEEPYEESRGECEKPGDRALLAAAPDLAATVEALHAELATARRILLALADACDDSHGVADDQIAAIGGALREVTGARSLLECGPALRRIVGGAP